MNGCLRPQRVRVRSDHEPTSGSNTAFTANPMASATPMDAGSSPRTWL